MDGMCPYCSEPMVHRPEHFILRQDPDENRFPTASNQARLRVRVEQCPRCRMVLLFEDIPDSDIHR